MDQHRHSTMDRPQARHALAAYLGAPDGPEARRRLDRLVSRHAAPAVDGALGWASVGQPQARRQTLAEADAEDAWGDAMACLLVLLWQWRQAKGVPGGPARRAALAADQIDSVLSAMRRFGPDSIEPDSERSIR